MTINGISFEDAHPDLDPEEPEPYHCGDGDSCCVGGWCGIDTGHCYPGSCNDPEDDAGCEHCGCCACTSCEYARVG